MEDLKAETLEAFFLCENSPGMCDRITHLIEQHQLGSIQKPQHIDLNVFELDIDHENGTISLQEVVSPCRELVMPLQDFLARLQVKRRV